MILARIAAACLGLSLLVACQKNDLHEPPEPMGDFALGLNIVVSEKMQKVAVSREATQEEWKAAMTKAVADRFARYNDTGTKLYNLGISVDAYALAPPGIPVVLKPRSALSITVTVWDDAAQKKLNPEAKQITVFEGASGKTFVGSGLTQTKEQQMEILSYNAAKAVQEWLLDNPEWFGLPPKPVKAPPTPTSMSARTTTPDPISDLTTDPAAPVVPLPPETAPYPIPDPAAPVAAPSPDTAPDTAPYPIPVPAAVPAAPLAAPAITAAPLPRPTE